MQNIIFCFSTANQQWFIFAMINRGYSNQWFDIEYGIYFMSETRFFIFSQVQNPVSRDIFNLKRIFSVVFYQIFDTASNTWHDVISACYFHIVKITLLIFSQRERNRLWRYNFYSMDKTQYFKAENVINIHIFSKHFSTPQKRILNTLFLKMCFINK